MTPKSMEPAEAVLRFLAGVGPGSEAEFYLRLFRSRARESFAAIVFDPETWRANAEGVALDLRLLASLSLTPVVVLGFYQPERAQEYATILATKLREAGVRSSTWESSASREAIADAANGGEIPMLVLAQGDDEAREAEFARVLAGLATHKLIFLRNEGPLSIDGKRLSVVNLGDEFSELMAGDALTPVQKRLLACSRRLVFELLPHELLATVTSPLSLLHELFTVKGAGTLLRRGVRVVRHDSLADIDGAALRALLEDSFGKPLSPNALARPIAHIYLEERYRGAAVVANTPHGAYLSKFAVTRQAQGEGIGRDLWQAMTKEHRTLFWRARRDNPIRSWYEQQCDGRMLIDGWIVYTIGVPPEKFADVIAFASSQPQDF